MAHIPEELALFTERVIYACGDPDSAIHSLLETFIDNEAVGVDAAELGLAQKIGEAVCEMDRYRIRHVVREIAPTNSSARKLAGPLLRALQFSSSIPIGCSRTI